VLHLRGETLGYGAIVVLRDIDFALAPGERVVVLGCSGAGKSTLLNAVYRRLTTLPAGAMRDIALVPQEPGLVPQLSVFHNVYMGRLDERGPVYNLANMVWPFAAERARIGAVLEVVGLDGFARAPVETLSGGQRQRTALARAIHRGGRVLIGDEPVSAVDERQAAELVAEIAGRFETLLLALHDVDLARSVATRVIGLKGGRIVLDRLVGELSGHEIDVLYRP
jgi:phosphonate transport system ATP-binding protein